MTRRMRCTTIRVPVEIASRSQRCANLQVKLALDRLTHRYVPFQEELMANEETATCPSCSLIVRVIYDPVSIGH